jgi:2-methylcitrate dehydratase PrpD
MGVAVRGSTADSSKAVHEFVRMQPPGRATVLAGSSRTSATWAALANGASAHATEMDDVTSESSLHPGAVVIPAALGLGEESGATGARALEAIIAGYEVTMRVGNALGAASAYSRGFHPTGVAGVFGAAVAAGKLRGLDADGLERAIGIAGTMASGSLEYLADGSWTKRLNPGWAAHAGIVAAGLAEAGFTGPATALDGVNGVLRGYTDAPDPERLTEGLDDLAASGAGERAGDLQVMRVSIKPYGCCRYSHGLIDAVLALRTEHFAVGSGGTGPGGTGQRAGGSGHGVRAGALGLDDVERIRLGVLSGGWSLIAEGIERKRDPRNVVDAQFSAPYAAAVALVHGRAGLAEFTLETMADPRVRALMARMECFRDPSLDAEYPRSWPALVEIHLRDGRVLRHRTEHALGEPENPVPRGALVDRFVEMVPARLDPAAARALAERILRLDEERDLSLLQELA